MSRKLDVTIDVAAIVKWIVILAIVLVAGVSPPVRSVCATLANLVSAESSGR
jgi:hypothetical protein